MRDIAEIQHYSGGFLHFLISLQLKFSMILAAVLLSAGCSEHPTLLKYKKDFPCIQYICAIRNTPTNNQAIIFVHGVFSDGFASWFNKDSGALWPVMLADDGSKTATDFDIYTINYNTPYLERAPSIPETTIAILTDMDDAKFFSKYELIHFVAHSMGGLIVKDMITKLNRPTQTHRLSHIGAVVLLATPSKGAQLAGMATWLSFNPQIEAMKSAVNNNFLQDLEERWQDLKNDRTKQGLLVPLVFCAHETKTTLWLSIVNAVEASTDCDSAKRAVAKDHVEISKPKNVNDDPYTWVLNRLKETKELAVTK